MDDWETCDMTCRQQVDESSCGISVLMVSNLTTIICLLIYAAVQFTFQSVNIIIMMLIIVSHELKIKTNNNTCLYIYN